MSTRLLASVLVPVLILGPLVGACGRSEPGVDRSTTTTTDTRPDRPEDVVAEWLRALESGRTDRATALADEVQLALLIGLETGDPAIVVRWLDEGVPDEVAMNFWAGFLDVLPGIAGRTIADLIPGTADVVEVEGVEFAVVELLERQDQVRRRIVLRRTSSGWVVDLLASFGAVFVDPLRAWYGALPVGEASERIGRAILAQRPSLRALLALHDLGAQEEEIRFLVEALLIEAGE